MTRERFQLLEACFHEALDLPESEREEFLRRQGDLEPELRSLLAVSERDEPAGPGAPAVVSGLRFGPFETEALLGRGGMASVYLARRSDGQFEQKVALKIMGAHLAGESFLSRFLAERQILAQLNHPNITRLLDGGMTPDGHPYLAMEYVDGLPLDRYADENKLPLRQRIELFLQVCGAISYAHQNLIVHRDLKPSNILVDRDGQVKLLDFGTAKLLSRDESFTMTGMTLLTPRYASPEQLRKKPVTTLSDVYSLGILLFELLGGRWPFGDPTTEMAEFVRLVENRVPDPLGHTVTAEAAAARSTSVVQLRGQISGDLRLITSKVLREDPQERYPSVEALAEDLRAYLANRPITARPATARYRLKKFGRRHRWGLATSALVLLSLAAGVVSTVREKHLTEQRFDEVRRLAHYQLFDLSDQLSAVSGTAKIRRSLVEQSTSYLDSLSRQAVSDTGLRAELAEGYLRLGDVSGNPYLSNLGMIEPAKAAYEKGLALAEPLKSGPARTTYALLQLNYGMLEAFTGRARPGSERIERGIAAIREVIAAHPAEAINYFHLGNALASLGMQSQQRGGLISAEDRSSGLYSQAIDAYERARQLDPGNPLLFRAMAQLYARRAARFTTVDPTQAIMFGEKALAILTVLPARDQKNPLVRKTVASIYGDLGWSFGQLHQFDKAQSTMDRNLEILLALSDAEPDDHLALYDLTRVHRSKGIVYGYAGNKRAAVEQFSKAAAIHDILLKDGPNTNIQFLRAELGRRISDLDADLGETNEAKRIGADAVSRLRALAQAPQPVASHLQEAALFLIEAKVTELRNPREALTYARKAAEQSPKDTILRETLARVLIANGDLDEAAQIAEPLLKEVLVSSGGARTLQVENLEEVVKTIAAKRKAGGH